MTLSSTHLLCIALLAPAASTAEQEQPDPSAVQTVIVTGSRIRSTESIGPVVALTSEQLTRNGNDSLGKVLQTLPYNTGAPTNTNVNNGGDGSTRVALRGLEPQRTLVLLNGRRLPNSGVGADASVDLDTLPLSLVERVEVLTTGASAVYGADAIGGVINVITRKHVDGAEVGAQYTQSDRGDGGVARAQALLGGELGEGRWMLGADYVDQSDVRAAAREHSASALQVIDASGALGPAGSPVLPDGRFTVGPGNALGLAPGPYVRVPGVVGQSAAAWRPATFSDTFNFAPYNYLQTPNERGSLWLMADRPLGEATEVFIEALLSRRESSQRLAPAPYRLTSDAAPLRPNGRPFIPASNYYNPFGVDILGPPPTNSRRLVELDNRGYEQEVDTWRALAGVRGDLGAWTWEAAAAYAESDAQTRENGVPVASRFIAGLGPSGPDNAGRIVCGQRDPLSGVVPQSAVIPGCTPIDLFGGAGSITRAQLDYLSGPLLDEGYNEQHLIDASFEGPWGSTSAGEIRWAFGAEYRYEAGAYAYDPERLGGVVGAGLNSDIPGGDFQALEAYVETRTPLLDSARWGELDAMLGARLSDFDTFGSHATWRAGLHWDWSESWVLRADYTTVFRAPALMELYTRQVAGDTAAFDPCGNAPDAQEQVNCAADGVPGGSYVQPPDAIAVVYAGGNEALEPEEGYTFSGGVEFRSRGALPWQIGVDYFTTRLDGYIANQSDLTILAECASTGLALACDKTQRLPDGSLDTIDARTSNYGSVSLSGVDAALSLTWPTRIGDVGVRALATRLLQFDTQAFEGGSAVDDVGKVRAEFVLPEWRALGGVDWTRGDWSAGYTAQWIGGYADCGVTPLGGMYCRNVPSVLYHDLEARYASRGASRGFTVRAGVSNLADRDPPFVGQQSSNTSAATYRLLGRTYFLELQYRR